MVNRYAEMLTAVKIATHMSTINGQHFGQLFRGSFAQIQAFWSTFDGKLTLEEGEHFLWANIMDWAGFEPATSRLRSEHYYP